MRHGGPQKLRTVLLNYKPRSSLQLPQKNGLRPRYLNRVQRPVLQTLQRWSSSKSNASLTQDSQRTQGGIAATSPAPAFSPRKWSTPLAKTIAQAIEVTGPIPIASYMRQCLTNPDGGYYTTTKPSPDSADQFGTAGDFITSPEISQIFGELVGIWFMTEWMAQGRPREGVQFIELGPGRGTLMSDVLRTIGQFGTFAKAIQAVWLVEAGDGLRVKQKDLLCGEEADLKEVSDDTGKNRWWQATSKQGIPIKWVEDIALLPEKREEGDTPFIIAHEFFDALPIHAFESVAPMPEEQHHEETKSQRLSKEGHPVIKPSAASKMPQWRELLVAPTKPKFNISQSSDIENVDDTKEPGPEPDFQLTLAKASTPSSLVIPERPRYRALKSQVSSRVEISPESSRYMHAFARLIGGENRSHSPNKQRSKAAGAALIIDYGPLETVPVHSLRGIRKHKIISPFVYAGEADISADVDFGALADAALEASPGVEVHGPVEQGMWLSQLGIQERAQRLMKGVEKENSGEVLEKKRRELEAGWRRLVEGGPKGMGKAYKVMTILPENGGKRRPVGFGGGVVG